MDVNLDDLDKGIARLMGWQGISLGNDGAWVGRSPSLRVGHLRAVPQYSSNLEAAWGVVNHLWQTRRLYVAIIGGGEFFRAEFGDSPDSARPIGAGSGKTAAEALCRAALDAPAAQGTS